MGRSKRERLDDVRKDPSKIEINWKRMLGNRREWRKIVELARLTWTCRAANKTNLSLY
jgi:hypothetical protein